jgi:hypothetical protein
MFLVSTIFGQLPSANPSCHSVIVEDRAVDAREVVACKDDKSLEEAYQSHRHLFSQHFFPCPTWFTTGNLQVPPAT